MSYGEEQQKEIETIRERNDNRYQWGNNEPFLYADERGA